MSTMPAWSVFPQDDGDMVVLHTLPKKNDRERASEWLRRHDIDPDVVVIPGFVRLDRDQRQIRYLTVTTDEQNRPVLDHLGFVKTVAVVQLEAAPQPWPALAGEGR